MALANPKPNGVNVCVIFKRNAQTQNGPNPDLLNAGLEQSHKRLHFTFETVLYSTLPLILFNG